MAKLKMEVSAEEGQMVGAFRNMGEAQKRFVQGSRGMGRASSTASNQIIAGLGGILASYLSINGAIRLGTALIEDRMRKEREAAQAHKTLAQERAGALWNLPRDISQDQLAGFIQKTARPDVGVTQAALWGAAKTGLSAKGGLGFEPWKEAMTEAGRISARTGEDFSVMAGAAIDLAKATGQTSAMANLGWMRQIGVAARVTDVAAQAATIPAAIVQAKAFGVGPEEAGEMFAAMSQLGVDPSGETTRTGMIRILQQSRYGKVLPGPGGRFGLVPETATTFAQRLKLLQTAYAGATPGVRGEMITKFGGRGPVKGFVAAMLAGGGLFEEYMGPARRQVGAPSATSAAEIKDFYASLKKGPGAGAEGVARIGRAGGVIQERMRLEDTEGAVASQLYQELFGGEGGGKGIMGVSDVSWFERQAMKARWIGGRQMGRTGPELLEEIRGYARVERTEDTELAASLRELAASLKENISDQQERE